MTSPGASSVPANMPPIITRAGAGGHGLGDVARVADAAVGNQRHARALERRGHVVDGHDLRHAHTGHDARGADGARADADLDRIGAGFDQRQRGRAGGDVAADHVHLREVLLDPAHALDHAGLLWPWAVSTTMASTPALTSSLHALFGALAHAHRGADAQLASGIARGIRETGLLGDVLDRDQALEFEGVVDDQQALELVLVQQRLGLASVVPSLHGDQLVARRHDLADRTS
jgi:hypothetical protein